MTFSFNNSDPFNQSALKMYKLVLVAMVTACVVGMAFWFLTKYLVARKSAYLELCRERSMERALRLYNHRGNVSTAADYDTSFFEHSALPGDQRQISEGEMCSRICVCLAVLSFNGAIVLFRLLYARTSFVCGFCLGCVSSIMWHLPGR